MLGDSLAGPRLRSGRRPGETLGADLIVLGTHRLARHGQVLLGSDAEMIVRLAPVPVLLVRAKAAAS